MKKKLFKINNIPAILWGEKSKNMFIAVHGSMSSKSDVPIELLAKEAVNKGYCVLSFDLPKHGDRSEKATPCKVQNCVEDLKTVMNFAKTQSENISLFANSMGCYFSLISFKDENIDKSLFLSPVVDMQRIIENMMSWSNVTPERLKKEKEILTTFGETLFWDYYQYVKQNSVEKWNSKTSILYGAKDNLNEFDRIESFTNRFNCSLTISEFSEHYFHTNEDLEFLEKWLHYNI